MRILSFHPIHRTWINSLAELFPEHSFELVTNPVHLSPKEQTMWESDMFPFVPNITHINKRLNEIQQDDYDLFITWQAIWMASPIRNFGWKIPGILFFHNVGEFPPQDWHHGPFVYNTNLTKARINKPGEVFICVRKKEAIGTWTGEVPKVYHINEILLKMGGLPFLYKDAYTRLKTDGYLYQFSSDMTWDSYCREREKLTAFIELFINRLNSCTFVEALRMGQPTIVPNKPDYNVFETQEGAMLFNTEQEAYNYSVQLTNDHELAEKIGKKGQEIFESYAADDIRREKMKKVFEEVLKK